MRRRCFVSQVFESKGTYQRVELDRETVVSPRDEAVDRQPVIEEVVKQQPRHICVAVVFLALAVPHARAQRQHERVDVRQRVVRLGALAEDVDEVPPDDAEVALLACVERPVVERVRVLADGDDRLVLA
jgi:hypothetical protein